MRACLLFAGVLTISSCRGRPAEGDMFAALTRALDQAHRTGARLPVGRLALKGWDRLEVFGPYTPRRRIESVVGLDARVVGSGIEGRDDVVLLVFLQGPRVVSVVLMPRAWADFSALAGQSLNRDDCIEIPARPLSPTVQRAGGC